MTKTKPDDLFAAPPDPDELLRLQLAGLRRMDPAAMKRYDYGDLRQREVMEEVMRRPWPRAKPGSARK